MPRKHQAQALVYLRQIPYAETAAEAARVLDRDWDRMITFDQFPKEHRRHLRTSNPIESPFSALRLRMDAARRFKKIENALAVIRKMMLVAESRLRHLRAPELMRDVYRGVKYVDGVKFLDRSTRAVA